MQCMTRACLQTKSRETLVMVAPLQHCAPHCMLPNRL